MDFQTDVISMKNFTNVLDMVDIVWIVQQIEMDQIVKDVVKIIINVKTTTVLLVIVMQQVLAVCNVTPKGSVNVNRESLAINVIAAM